jgi:hypothetical protein
MLTNRDIKELFDKEVRTVKVKFRADVKGIKVEEIIEINTDYISVNDEHAVKALIDSEYVQWLLGFEDEVGYEIIT